MAKNVFQNYADEVYPYKYRGRIAVRMLMGGTPSDQKVAEGWLKSKMGVKDEMLQEAVQAVMTERGITSDEAVKVVDNLRHLNGFKRDPDDGLYIEGRHLKAAIKEAASVARAVNNLSSRMGATSKGTLSFIAEHVIVVEDRLYLDRQEADGVIQSFPKNPMTKQTGIQYTEYLETVDVHFTIATDHQFTEREWAVIFLTGGQQGIGASRSQGYGRYDIIEWTPIGDPKRAKKTAELATA